MRAREDNLSVGDFGKAFAVCLLAYALLQTMEFRGGGRRSQVKIGAARSSEGQPGRARGRRARDFACGLSCGPRRVSRRSGTRAGLGADATGFGRVE